MVVQVVAGETEGNKSIRTSVIRVKALDTFKAEKLVLAPFGGTIVDITTLGEKKKVYPTNPSQIATVPAKVTTGTPPVTSANPVARVPKTSNFIIVSPLVDSNARMEN